MQEELSRTRRDCDVRITISARPGLPKQRLGLGRGATRSAVWAMDLRFEMQIAHDRQSVM